MKRIISIMTVIVLSVCFLSACVDEKPEEKSGMLFWEVSDKKGNKIYLLGSIHVGDASIYPLNEIVMDYYNKSDSLAVEADIESALNDTQVQIKLIQQYMYTDGTTIDNHIDPQLFQDAKNYLIAKGSYDDMFLYLKPMFWADLIGSLTTENSSLSSEKGVDLYFIKEAKASGKELLEIESIEMQAKMLGGLKDEIQELYLSDVLATMDSAEQSTKELFDLWKTGDHKKLEKYVFDDAYPDDAPDEVKKLYDEYMKILYEDRNKGMVDKAVEYIKSGKTVFIVVGAAHMVGESGLVNQLAEKGYSVKKK